MISQNDTQEDRENVIPGSGRTNESVAEVLSNIVSSELNVPIKPFDKKTRLQGTFLVLLSIGILIFIIIGSDDITYIISIYVCLLIIAYVVYINKRELVKVDTSYIILMILFLLLTLAQGVSDGLAAFSTLMITLILLRLMFLTYQPILILPVLYSGIYLYKILTTPLNSDLESNTAPKNP